MPNILRLGIAVSMAAFACWPGRALAAGESPATTTSPYAGSGTLTLQVENDLFAKSDRHYTNGLRLGYITGPDAVPEWVPLTSKEGVTRAGVAVGQAIFTPRDITRPIPDPSDRPYAGWLFAGLELFVERDDQLDSIEIDLGVVGPSSLAEPSQKFVHSLIGEDEPRGWDSQLRDEPGIMLTFQRTWRNVLAYGIVDGVSLDVEPHVGVTLGNVMTTANAGAVVRLGTKLPHDYGPPRLRPSPPGSEFFLPTDELGWYVFAGVDGRLVGRNIFLDGNTFRDSPSVDKYWMVGDIQAGIALTYGRWRVAYTQVFRTPEFHGQTGLDRFGALTVSMKW